MKETTKNCKIVFTFFFRLSVQVDQSESVPRYAMLTNVYTICPKSSDWLNKFPLSWVIIYKKKFDHW